MSGGVLWAKEEEAGDSNNVQSPDDASADRNGASIFHSNVFGSVNNKGSSSGFATSETATEGGGPWNHHGRKQRGYGRIGEQRLISQAYSAGSSSGGRSSSSSSGSGGVGVGSSSRQGKWKRRVRLRYDLPGAGHSGGDALGNAQVQSKLLAVKMYVFFTFAFFRFRVF